MNLLSLMHLYLILSRPATNSLFQRKKNIYDVIKSMINEIVASRPSIGVCTYNFKDIALNRNEYFCDADDVHILGLMKKKKRFTPQVRVKCVEPVPVDDKRFSAGRLLHIRSYHELNQLLQPYGHGKARYEAGSCVFLLFCLPSSLPCANIAKTVNALPRQFPTLRFAYIDASKLQYLNVDYGIVGVPTLFLFHQGYPIVKLYSNKMTYKNFITQHTGIKPKPLAKDDDAPNIDGAMPLQPVEEIDYMLILAWLVIISCSLYYLRQHIFDFMHGH